MPTITLKDLPRALHRQLKSRAKANHRSLNKEVVATLQKSTSEDLPIEVASLTQTARALRREFSRPVTAAEIDTWKKMGRR